jgi:hypothetical protein
MNEFIDQHRWDFIRRTVNRLKGGRVRKKEGVARF